MKLGKTKLKRMLSEETGIPPQDIADFGKYEYYGNKEQLSVETFSSCMPCSFDAPCIRTPATRRPRAGI